MAKNKLHRFAENLTFDNLFQLTYPEAIEPFPFKGIWCKNYFKNSNPIVLELGCGRGEYTTGLAATNPLNNYIGIDHKGARIWRGAKTAKEDKLAHAAFVRMRIDFIENIFITDEVSEIWITFPEPQMHKLHKRLTSPEFLEKYKNFVKKGGIIHLKTDNDLIYADTLAHVNSQGLQILYQTTDVYAAVVPVEVKSIQTFYEQMFLAKEKNINYLKFVLH